MSVVKEELIERRSYDAAFGALNARVVVAYWRWISLGSVRNNGDVEAIRDGRLVTI